MTQKQLLSPLKLRVHKPQLLKKQQKIIYTQQMIKQIYQNLTQQLTKLSQSYTQLSSKNQTYLLYIFLKIMDKILNDLLYQKQQLHLINYQQAKQYKSIDYLQKINKSRSQCFTIKNLLIQKQQQLKSAQIVTQNLNQQIQELFQLYHLKKNQVQHLKTLIIRNPISALQKISTIIESSEHQQQSKQILHPPNSKKTLIINKQQKHLSHSPSPTNCTTQLRYSPHPKTKRQFSQSTSKCNQSSAIASPNIKTYQDFFPSITDSVDQMGKTQWLYRTKYRQKFVRSQLSYKSSQKKPKNTNQFQSTSTTIDYKTKIQQLLKQLQHKQSNSSQQQFLPF